jgi:hypothetical protein
VFPSMTLGMLGDRLTRYMRPGDQVLIAAISGPTPKIVVIHLRL